MIAMAGLTLKRQPLAATPPWLATGLVSVLLTWAPPGNAQMLMNLAPQALPNSSVGPSYSNTLSTVKQALTTPTPGTNQSQSSPLAPGPDAPANQAPLPHAPAPALEACELKVAQMNAIQQRKVVRVHSGPCLMVFNAND
jgi:hypothetical protein